MRGGQPESLSEIDFLERRINDLRAEQRRYVIDSWFRKIYFRHAPELGELFSDIGRVPHLSIVPRGTILI